MYTNDAGTYVIAVYCEGVPGDRHERFDIILYGRLVRDTFPDGRDWIPIRQWTDGRLVRARAHDVHNAKGRPEHPRMRAAGMPHNYYQYRFRCPRCGLDEQRTSKTDFVDIFDRLAEHDVHDIPVRKLVTIAWG